MVLKDDKTQTVHIVELPRYDVSMRLLKTLESDALSAYNTNELFDASGMFQEKALAGSSIHAILRVIYKLHEHIFTSLWWKVFRVVFYSCLFTFRKNVT